MATKRFSFSALLEHGNYSRLAPTVSRYRESWQDTENNKMMKMKRVKKLAKNREVKKRIMVDLTLMLTLN